MIVVPFLFRALVPPDQLQFNHKVAMDLIWLESTPILHDTHMKLRNATVIRTKAVDDIWISIVECLATFYTGYSYVICFYQETRFTGKPFSYLATVHGVKLQFLWSQCHNSAGSEEKYLKPYRQVFCILRQWCLNMEPEILLRFAVKGLKDAMGSNGYVPSLLLLGTLFTLSMLNKDGSI